MDTVIVGVDNSDASTRAVEFAVERAQKNEWKLVLVTVIPWSPFTFNTPSENDERHAQRKKELEYADTQIIEPMLAIATRAKVEAESAIRHGSSADILLDFVTENKAIHVIVGRTGDSGIRNAFFGSTTSRLIQHAQVPVTVVP